MLKARIATDLKFVNQIGSTLSPREKLSLGLALLKLEESHSYDAFFFWGRVAGVNRNYYIGMGLRSQGQYEFPVKEFFWCSEDFQFSVLPAPLWAHAQAVY
jgi:radial spoke head protein 9